MKRRILGISVSNQRKVAEKVQKILTTYGCSIRTRLGLNETDDDTESGGLILLELIGDENEWTRLESELSAIEHTELKRMDFSS
ncbi:hypothetical protein [Lentimicrobium sp.]|uniref:hypothetical protein n=1 Tax=Lentimicrobium sp. TaxID=2034841 RepID=UPI00345EA674